MGTENEGEAEEESLQVGFEWPWPTAWTGLVGLKGRLKVGEERKENHR